MIVEISKSNNKNKKFKAVINGGKTIHFGHSQYQDYTTHNDNQRKERYINRHKERENWTKSGVDTAGFYAKHILWGEKTIEKSIDKLNNKYKDITFKYKK